MSYNAWIDASYIYSYSLTPTGASTTLNGGITATATTITLADASSFATSGKIRIGYEIISYTGKSGNNLTGATRGVEFTGAGYNTGYSHNSGDTVDQVTTAYSSNNASSTTFDYFQNTIQVGDILWIGRQYYPFDDIEFNVGTALAADSIALEWQYHGDDGATWANLTVTDNTNSFRTTGQNTVTFEPPQDWVYQYWTTGRSVRPNSMANTIWVRVRVTAVTNPTEGGANSSSKAQIGNNTLVVTGGSAGSRLTLADVAAADTSWGVITQAPTFTNSSYRQQRLYQSIASLQIGDGSTSTYFNFKGDAFYSKIPNTFVKNTANSDIIGGSSTTTLTQNAVINLSFSVPSGTYIDLTSGTIVMNGFIINLSTYDTSWNGSSVVKLGGTWTHCSITGNNMSSSSGFQLQFGTNSSFTQCSFHGYIQVYPGTGGTITDSRFMNSGQYGVVWATSSLTFTGIDFTFTGSSPIPGHVRSNGTVLTLRNPINASNQADGYIPAGAGYTPHYHKNFSFDLKVQDSNGNVVQGASVAIKNVNGTAISGSPFTTDSNGNISQQWLTYTDNYFSNTQTYQWTTMDQVDTLSPYTVTISKSGYETRTIKYTMDRKREEIEVLKAAPAGYVIVPNKGTGIVRVLGTEYGGSESGALYAQVLNQDGTPANGATVTITVYKSDGTAWVSSQSMTYITASNGIYKYTFTSPTDVGVYVADVSTTSPTAYGTGEFHVSQWAKNVATSSAQIANLPVASDIWAYSSRSLSSFGSLVSDIWGSSTRSLTTFGTLIADIWSYTTRTLTESALSAADVWNYATRTLTGASLTSGQLATKTNIDEATSSAVLSIKTSSDYDLGDIIGYVDTLETNIGTSSDTASSNTVFGKIKGVQNSVDQLTTIDTNIDTLVSKWGSYSASDIYDKVKNLSSDISAINTVSNVSSILSLAQTNETNITEVKNKVLAMKAVVDVNRTLLEKVSNQPIIKTWLEEGSIIFKTLITNPSTIAFQTVPLKYYLPRELQKEDIIKIDENLKVDYDTSQEAYFVSGEFDLKPGETKIIAVEVKDIWEISEDEVKSLRKQAEELSKPLKGTSYFAQGTLVKSDIDVSLDKILRIQKDAITPQGRIRAYREAKAEMQIVTVELDTMKTLVASAGSMGTMFGFIGGVQTLGAWGLIIVLIGGFVFLALYIRMLSLQQHNHIERGYGIKTAAVIDFWAPIRPMINKKIIRIVIIAFLTAGFTMFIVNFLTTRMRQNNLPAGINVPKQESNKTPTPTPTAQPKKDKSENEEIKVTDEKQILGTTTGAKIKVIVPENDAVNIRKEPSLESEVIGKFWLTREVTKLSEKEEWVKIKVSIEKEGVKYSEGWVSKQFIEEL